MLGDGLSLEGLVLVAVNLSGQPGNGEGKKQKRITRGREKQLCDGVCSYLSRRGEIAKHKVRSQTCTQQNWAIVGRNVYSSLT